MSLLARRPDVKLKRRAIRRFDTYYKRMANYRRNWPSTIKKNYGPKERNAKVWKVHLSRPNGT